MACIYCGSLTICQTYPKPTCYGCAYERRLLREPPPVYPPKPDAVTMQPVYLSPGLRSNMAWTKCPRCYGNIVDNPKRRKRHYQTVACKENAEKIEMNKNGLFIMRGIWYEMLRPFVVAGKYGKYVPATIASYINYKWIRGNNNANAFARELREFVNLSFEEQENHLLGLILEYEISKENQVMIDRR